MKLLYGTGNPAKLNGMRNHLRNLDIELVGLNELNLSCPVVKETGKNPLENAREKALAYYRAFHLPVFSCDSGLYIEGLSEKEQPGVHVRRVNGKILTDEEMIDYYSGLIKRHGGSCAAQYRNAICLVMGEQEVYECEGEEISGEKFLLTAVPHQNREKGFPLDCLSKDMVTGKYFYDMDELLIDAFDEGFEQFFRMALGL